MKKFISAITVLLATLMLFSLVACGGNEGDPNTPGGTVKPGATVALNKTELTLNEGETERLTATTDPEGESVSFASSDDSIVTVSVTGLVSAKASGTATVTATVESSGNTAECTVTVNAQQLNIPTSEDIIRLDETKNFALVKEDAQSDVQLSRSGDVTSVTYTAAIVQSESWNNQIYLDVTGTDVTRKTDIGFNFKGNGEDVFMAIFTKSQETIIEQTFSTTAGWNTYTAEIPEAKRYMLATAERVVFTVPVPSARYNGNGGTAYFGGVWFFGDAEPAVQKVYKYEEYDVVATLDLSKWNEFDWDMTFKGEDRVESGDTYVEGTYNEEDGSLTIKNHGYGQWIAMPFNVPKADYSDVECIAVRAKGTKGAVIAGQISYQNAFSLRNFTEEEQWMFCDVTDFPVEDNARVVSLAPCQFVNGYSEWEVTIYSVELLKPRDPSLPPRPLPEESSDIPEGADRIDEGQNYTVNPDLKGWNGSITPDAEGNTTVEIKGSTIRGGNGEHWVYLSLEDRIVENATHLNIRIKGTYPVTTTLRTADGEIILQQRVLGTSRWQVYKFEIPEDKRELLDDTCILTFLSPDYDPNFQTINRIAPTMCYGGVWFDGATAHVHTFAEEWTSDETNHWHAATCGHTEEKGSLAAHEFGDDDVCDVCGYDSSVPHEHTFADEWTYDETGHWHAATCGHTEEKGSFAEHVDADSNGKCDVCGEDMPTTEPEEPTETGITFAITDMKTYQTGFSVKVNGGETNIEAKGVAVRAQDGTNTVSASLEGIELGGKTKLSLNAGGYWFNSQKDNEKQDNAVSITVKVMGADSVITEQTFELTEAGQDFVLTAADFSGATSIQIVVPVYDAEMAGTQGMRANVTIANVHFE